MSSAPVANLRSGPWLAAVCGFLVVLSRPQAATVGIQFRSGIDQVVVHATVSDKDGRPVIGLGQPDFRVYEDGHLVDVTAFSASQQALHVGIMVDTGVGRLPRGRALTAAFVKALGPDDEAFIGSFGWEVSVSPILTRDDATLQRVMDEELWPSPYSPAWFGIEAARAQLVRLSLSPWRNVLLIVSDPFWLECSPAQVAGRVCVSYNTVRTRVEADDVGVYAAMLGTSSRSDNRPEDRRLAALTVDSGGTSVSVNAVGGVDKAVGRLIDAMRSSYLIGFEAGHRDGRLHKIEVKGTEPALVIRARRAYQARQAGE